MCVQKREHVNSTLVAVAPLMVMLQWVCSAAENCTSFMLLRTHLASNCSFTSTFTLVYALSVGYCWAGGHALFW